jgi:phage baseplate assembly protein W
MSNQQSMDLKGVPYFVAHDASEIDLARRSRRAPVLRGVAGPTIPGAEPDGNGMVYDLDTMAGRENLAQALILRLLTPRGSLASLGHAAYGSRLHELIGRLKTDAVRNLCRAFVLETVAQEPRVENQAVELTFDPLQEGPSSLVFTLAVRPIDGEEPIGLSLEVEI